MGRRVVLVVVDRLAVVLMDGQWARPRKRADRADRHVRLAHVRRGRGVGRSGGRLMAVGPEQEGAGERGDGDDRGDGSDPAATAPGRLTTGAAAARGARSRGRRGGRGARLGRRGWLGRGCGGRNRAGRRERGHEYRLVGRRLSDLATPRG
jgi:hypothetical protein